MYVKVKIYKMLIFDTQIFLTKLPMSNLADGNRVIKNFHECSNLVAFVVSKNCYEPLRLLNIFKNCFMDYDRGTRALQKM